MDAVIYLRVSTKEQAAKDGAAEGSRSRPSGRRAFAKSPSAAGTSQGSSSTPASPRAPPTARC
jgi:hypothetical protein